MKKAIKPIIVVLTIFIISNIIIFVNDTPRLAFSMAKIWSIYLGEIGMYGLGIFMGYDKRDDLSINTKEKVIYIFFSLVFLYMSFLRSYRNTGIFSLTPFYSRLCIFISGLYLGKFIQSIRKINR